MAMSSPQSQWPSAYPWLPQLTSPGHRSFSPCSHANSFFFFPTRLGRAGVSGIRTRTEREGADGPAPSAGRGLVGCATSGSLSHANSVFTSDVYSRRMASASATSDSMEGSLSLTCTAGPRILAIWLSNKHPVYSCSFQHG